MVDEEKLLEVQMYEPRFKIGQTVFLPCKNGVSATKITGYISHVNQSPEGKLISGVRLYQINTVGIERIGSETVLNNELTGRNFYTDKAKAQSASRFLEVDIDNELWKIAIGDREIKDENSPYSLSNCNLKRCCANISEARDILCLCIKQKGLLVHDRDEMRGLIFDGHDFKYNSGSPIDKIFRQLEINRE
jgi:hypothetical protein